MTTTRSSAEVWLIAKSTKVLSSARLPTKLDVLRKLVYYPVNEKQVIKKAIRQTLRMFLRSGKGQGSQRYELTLLTES